MASLLPPMVSLGPLQPSLPLWPSARVSSPQGSPPLSRTSPPFKGLLLPSPASSPLLHVSFPLLHVSSPPAPPTCEPSPPLWPIRISSPLLPFGPLSTCASARPRAGGRTARVPPPVQGGVPGPHHVLWDITRGRTVAAPALPPTVRYRTCTLGCKDSSPAALSDARALRRADMCRAMRPHAFPLIDLEGKGQANLPVNTLVTPPTSVCPRSA